MDSRKPILVTGASGKTGTRCVMELVARGCRVRALVRREAAAERMRNLGAAEVVVGDMFDDAVMVRAVNGAAQVLHICPPMHPEEDALAARMIAHAGAAGIAQFVLWSVLHPHIDVPHHRRKQRAEAALIDSGLPFTVLQPCRYMQHLETIWPAVRDTGVHGFPFSTAARFSLVHLGDLAEAAAVVLTAPGHLDAIYELAGPNALSQADCATIISAALGRHVAARAAPLDEVLARASAAGLPDWRLETLAVMNRHYDAHGLAGNPNVLRWLLGREPKTFAGYVAELIAADG